MIETYEKTRQRTLVLELLGRVLLAQSKYDDARRAFESVIRMAPKRPAAFSGLAETRLLQGIEIGQALENVRRARQLQSERKRLASVWADEAWALAILGRSAEAQQALEAGAHDMASRDDPARARTDVGRHAVVRKSRRDRSGRILRTARRQASTPCAGEDLCVKPLHIPREAPGVAHRRNAEP